MSLLELEPSERLSAPVAIETLYDLADWWWTNGSSEPSPPSVLAWDMRRLWGDNAFALWRDLMWQFEPPEFFTGEQFEAALVEQWALYDRPQHFTDQLVIDVMADERERGFKPWGDALGRTETVLNDLAARVGAKRAAEKAEEDAREKRYLKRLDRFVELDEAGYENWLAAERPDGEGVKFNRWFDRHFRERLEIIDRSTKHKATPMPLADHPNLTAQQAVALDDFYAYLPGGGFIFTPTREIWPSTSVNSKIGPVAVPMREKPIHASTWLAQHRAVEQMSWAPGMPMVIDDRLIADGGWIDRAGCRTFNLYRGPVVKRFPGDASRWVKHIEFVYGSDVAHIIKWLAQRVQNPQIKINHALVLGGAQGIGKDTLLEPVKSAVGPWNFTEVSPTQVLGRFNGHVKSVILRVSEARDLGDVDRFGFYEHMKTLTAAPPDVLRVDEKHTREHAVLNVCGIVITTNNKDSLHLPADDRRHFVAWSSRTKEEFGPDYWNDLYRWFARGGTEIVADYLATLDLAGFDPKAPPPKTEAFWQLVDSSRAPEDAELADALDRLGNPAAVTLAAVIVRAAPEFSDWLRDRKNRRKVPHRFNECGYVPVRNPDASDGLWKIAGKRQAVYARRELSPRDQIEAATRIGLPSLPPPPG